MRKATAVITSAVILFLVAGGTSVLIAWAVDRMKSPSFFLQSAAITTYNLTSDNRLNATVSLSIRSHNRDSKYTIKYQAVAVVVFHNGFGFAFENIPGGPFVQHRGDDMVFDVSPTTRDVVVEDPTEAGVLRREAKEGKLELEVRVRAKVRFQVKHWKHRSYVLKVVCPSVGVDLASGKGVLGGDCLQCGQVLTKCWDSPMSKMSHVGKNKEKGHGI